MREFNHTKSPWLFVIVILSLSLFTVVLITNFFIFTSEQQYYYLSKSFLSGKLHFIERPDTWSDLVLHEGKMYWHMGPFPAILMMPFVALFSLVPAIFYQGYLQYFLTVGVFCFAYKLAIKHKYSLTDAYFLAFAVVFASVYQIAAFASWPWYLAHAVTAFFGFWAIYEHFGKKRYWLIGTLYALTFATRITAGLGILFFALEILFHKGLPTDKFRKLFKLLTPFVAVGVFLLLYNYLRFGNLLRSGYGEENVGIVPDSWRYEEINYGIFQIRNIPTNLYYYFLHTLEPVKETVKTVWGNTHMLKPPYLRLAYPGTSVFVVAPLFLYVLRSNIKKKVVKYSLVPIVAILGVLMLYYWPGWRQVGPRYLVDLLPFAYLMLIYSFKQNSLTWFLKLLIMASALFNIYLLQSAFSI